jgi:hypothetical protein
VKKKLITATVAIVALLGTTASACNDDADVASDNISKAADNFEIQRRIVVINTISGVNLMVIEGRCSIKDEGRQLEITCKSGKDTIKNFVGLGPHITYLIEQMIGVNVSVDHYRRSLKPEAIIPDIHKQ